ncbi:MAG: hypothetical protein IH903_00375 [Proteobacteria bacterium]|nr:hypothetical protein [Pseudomonadota bacterium]
MKMARLSRAELRKCLGASPRELDRELNQYRETVAVFSQSHPRLIDKYPKQWIGVYRGDVAASGKTLKAVLRQLKAKHIPKERVLVRYIDRNQRTMIF